MLDKGDFPGSTLDVLKAACGAWGKPANPGLRSARGPFGEERLLQTAARHSPPEGIRKMASTDPYFGRAREAQDATPEEAIENGCSFCKQHSEEPYIEIEWPYDSEHANFCSWLCLVQFATFRNNGLNELSQRRLRSRIEALEEQNKQLERDCYLLPYYRAGCI
jgi:hypothetical protein